MVRWPGVHRQGCRVHFQHAQAVPRPPTPTGLWQHFASVTAPDANTVVMTLQGCLRRRYCHSLSRTYIVPQHIWSSVGDPTKYTNTQPVGTGPMKLKSFRRRRLSTTSRIPRYWQADKVKVDELDYPVVNSNDTALLKMASHQADWTGIFSAALRQPSCRKIRRTTTYTWFQSCRCRSCPTSRIRCWLNCQCARPSAPRSTAADVHLW